MSLDDIQTNVEQILSRKTEELARSGKDYNFIEILPVIEATFKNLSRINDSFSFLDRLTVNTINRFDSVVRDFLRCIEKIEDFDDLSKNNLPHQLVRTISNEIKELAQAINQIYSSLSVYLPTPKEESERELRKFAERLRGKGNEILAEESNKTFSYLSERYKRGARNWAYLFFAALLLLAVVTLIFLFTGSLSPKDDISIGELIVTLFLLRGGSLTIIATALYFCGKNYKDNFRLEALNNHKAASQTLLPLAISSAEGESAKQDVSRIATENIFSFEGDSVFFSKRARE